MVYLTSQNSQNLPNGSLGAPHTSQNSQNPIRVWELGVRLGGEESGWGAVGKGEWDGYGTEQIQVRN